MEMQIEKVLDDNHDRPFLIAGPCSAESEEQVLETAHKLVGKGVDLFRAGIWKPRTRPGSFEGVGTVGLKWLKKVKEEVGLKVTTEVANKQHVFEALKYGIDVVWLGARTTVNPFSVQEVADALEGIDIPVLIKNPINPDLSLWIGAIERIYKAGIRRIGVIHRGFSSFGNSKFRNDPMWQIPIELMRRFPNLTIICDNSHICGRRDILAEIAQKSMDLNFDGLMTETHPNPDEAWSDAKQQITPDVYLQMISELVYRVPTTDNQQFLQNLDDLRGHINNLDNELLTLLGKRMEVAEQIGLYKKQNNISILQPTRWNEILQKAIHKGANHGLSGEFIQKFLRAIHEESINHQEKVMNQ
ncbi:MAG: bifunctional 3-deoxy-7-phosphoheptulonate synthase/chorismate mutase type II [Bacteroidota bacterium]